MITVSEFVKTLAFAQQIAVGDYDDSNEAIDTIQSIFEEELESLYDVPGNSTMEELMEQGLGSESEAAKGTAFGLVQAFTQFADWEAGRGQDARLFNAWFGQNDKLKTKLVGMLAEAA
jgi:hypothetical protein